MSHSVGVTGEIFMVWVGEWVKLILCRYGLAKD